MSRRAAEDAIRQGRVRLNGEPAQIGAKVDVESDLLTLDGVPVPVNPVLETHLLYKPAGVISTAHDPHRRRTVVDLIPSKTRLYPVGRLDADSEGLILVSNDGMLTERVTHPRYGITKTYLARVEGRPTKAVLRRLVEGVELEDGPARAQSARLTDTREGEALVEVVMVEGRNREVRRLMAAVGHPVTRLVRTAIGPISDPRLRPGESRRLGVGEIRRLLASGSRS